MHAPEIRIDCDVSVNVNQQMCINQGELTRRYSFSVGDRAAFLDWNDQLLFVEPNSIVIRSIFKNFLLITHNCCSCYLIDVQSRSISGKLLALAGEERELQKIAQKVNQLRAACLENGYHCFYHSYSANPQALIIHNGGFLLFDGIDFDRVVPDQYNPSAALFTHNRLNYYVSDVNWGKGASNFFTVI